MRKFDMEKVKNAYEYAAKIIGYIAVGIFVSHEIGKVSSKIMSKIINVIQSDDDYKLIYDSNEEYESDEDIVDKDVINIQ